MNAINNNQNPMNNILSMLARGYNPKQIVQNVMMQNPQFKAMVNQANGNGMSMEEFAKQYAKQNNIDINNVINMFSNYGIKL